MELKIEVPQGYEIDKENWKDVLNYEDRYEVSNYGNIRSKERMKYNGKRYHKFKSKILNQRLDSLNRYLLVSFYKNTHKTFLVHRVVAKAFIPNPLNLPQINHINENKTDNRISNLEWCTNQTNNILRFDKSKTSSKYTGVSYNKLSKKWQARGYKNNKRVGLGYFDTEIEAYNAYLKNKKELL